jgi:hypothetical protein
VRLRLSSRWLGVVAAAWCGCVVALAGVAWPSSATAAPDEAEVEQALEQVRKDPNLSAERTIRTLKWVSEDEPEPPQASGWGWVRGMFDWIAGTSRVLLWAIIITLLALLVLFMVRTLKSFEPAPRSREPDAPTHVRELDIRPESLPDDIGTEAFTLWQRNEHRAALALLYRGLLSRLVHAHGVPIRQSSTEADCLGLALPRLSGETADYTTGLVAVWQRAVYGARDPDTEEVRTLCNRFDRAFPALARPAADSA